jgi:hypothetical protein
MKTKVKILVPRNDYMSVNKLIKDARVKHDPHLRTWGGYWITLEESPLATMLAIKYTDSI